MLINNIYLLNIITKIAGDLKIKNYTQTTRDKFGTGCRICKNNTISNIFKLIKNDTWNIHNSCSPVGKNTDKFRK